MERKNETKQQQEKAFNTQVATLVANGIEHFVIQKCTAKRWVLRAFLNEVLTVSF